MATGGETETHRNDSATCTDKYILFLSVGQVIHQQVISFKYAGLARKSQLYIYILTHWVPNKIAANFADDIF